MFVQTHLSGNMNDDDVARQGVGCSPNDYGLDSAESQTLGLTELEREGDCCVVGHISAAARKTNISKTPMSMGQSRTPSSKGSYDSEGRRINGIVGKSAV